MFLGLFICVTRRYICPLFCVSQILSYNVKIWRNLTQTVRQKIVAVNRTFFWHVWNCSSTVHHPPFLRLESYRSAAKFLGAPIHRDAMKRCINMPFINAERRDI